MSNQPNRNVKVMNGLSLVFFGYVDFGAPGRRDRWGNHTTLEAALRVVARRRIALGHAGRPVLNLG